MHPFVTYGAVGFAIVASGVMALVITSSQAPPPAPRHETASAAGERAPTTSSIWTANPKELVNTRYGISFKYPNDWGPGPRHDASVRESVGRRDGAFCYVFVYEQRLPADDTGRPTELGRVLRGFEPRHLQLKIPGLKTTVDSFERSTLGGQESRRFLINFQHNLIGHIKVRGQATLRDFGGIGIGCAAPVEIFSGPDLQAAFDLVFRTFAFDGRAR
jgi:hypothetical protein